MFVEETIRQERRVNEINKDSLRKLDPQITTKHTQTHTQPFHNYMGQKGVHNQEIYYPFKENA